MSHTALRERQARAICRVSNLGRARMLRSPNRSGLGRVYGYSKCRKYLLIHWVGRLPVLKSVKHSYVEFYIDGKWIEPIPLPPNQLKGYID